jgi:hypothetical protein
VVPSGQVAQRWLKWQVRARAFWTSARQPQVDLSDIDVVMPRLQAFLQSFLPWLRWRSWVHLVNELLTRCEMAANPGFYAAGRITWSTATQSGNA